MRLSERVKNPIWQLWLLVKWTLYSCGAGGLVGLVAVAFHYSIAYGTQLRAEHPRMIWLLPSAGVTIVMLYRICKMEKDRHQHEVGAPVLDRKSACRERVYHDV